MTKFASETDLFTGIKETVVVDDGKIQVHQTQDLQPYLDANQAEMQVSGDGFKGETFYKVASIPALVIELWAQELKDQGADNAWPLAKCNEKWFTAKLNSSEFLKLRTKTGRV